MKHRYALNLAARTLLILSGVAAFSTALALVMQDRALSGDLRGAAERRLVRAVSSTQLLVDAHLDAQKGRYRAISGTPQFRATLEVGDLPTLRFYARQLREREGAALIAFLDREGRPAVIDGDASLIAGLPGVSGEETAMLLAEGGQPYAAALIPLQTSDLLVGGLVALEAIEGSLVESWSDLCGAEVSFGARAGRDSDTIERIARELSGLDLRVAVSLDSERAALAHSRQNLLTAGGVALLLAFFLSVPVSRGLVRPILQIQHATRRIGEGDFAVRLASERSDEIGGVSRAVDGMADRLLDYRVQVESQHQALQENFERLRRSQGQLANAQRLAHIGSWHIDLETRQLLGSDEFRRIFGLDLEQKPIEPDAVLDAVHEEDRAGLASAIRSCLEEGTTLRLDCRISLAAAKARILHAQAELVRDAAGVPLRLEGTVQDVTERKRSEEQIRYLAHHDSLTGLGNRLLCRERLEIQLAQARRSGTTLGVLFLDLDHFKRINDTLGHSLGDELLKGVADRLVSSVRDTDYVGRADLDSSISRLGGDEFTVVVSDTRDVQDLARVARRVLQALARPFGLGGHDVVISGSIGITAFPHDGDDAETLLRNADAAMYHAKEQGRSNYQFYAQSMNEIAMRRLILEGKMRQGLERGEFELYYQPKISLRTGAVTGVEALARWREPESGLVGPNVFIPIAEETGLIVPMGEWALRTACAQIAAWSARGHDVPISVNLSTHQFRSGKLAEKIIAILEQAEVPPKLLELEITESMLMHDESAVIADLNTLRAQGIGISVDDFGTGYSSFAYLRRLPVDALKLDRSFIIDIAESKDAAALAASIVSMGKALGLRVIAEGVETVEQRELLATWGCDEIQGFLHSPAIPAAELAARFLGLESA